MTDPYHIDNTPAVISMSGGRTSAYMTRMILEYYDFELPDDVVVLFCNTGKEHPATLDFVRDCQQNWGIDVTWLEYRYFKERKGGRNDPRHHYVVVSYETASRKGEPFSQLIRAKWKCPSIDKRFCTSELKVNTIKRYVERELGWKDHTVLLGMRYDEPQRINKSLMEMCRVDYPLAHAHVSVRNVNEYWQSNYFDLAIPNYLGNCDLCFLKNDRKLLHIAREHPEMLDWWQQEEIQLHDRLKERHGWVTIKAQFNPHCSYTQLEEAAHMKMELFDNEDMGFGDDIDCFCGD